MLVNFSNHPFHQWDSNQLDMAERIFGEIMDFPFPAIPPQDEMKDVKKKAKLSLSEIRKIYPHNIAILIAGEQSFVIAFYLLAKRNGIDCYVATSERNTVIHSSGTKTVSFNFIKFRKL